MFPENTFPAMTPQSFLRSALEYAPDAGAYLGEHVAQAFDRTTTGRAMEEYDIMRAEKEEGAWDETYAQGHATQEFTGPFAGLEPPAHRHAMSEEEWKNSPYYIPTAKYRPDMTETRARIMKENYDQRRYRESLIAAGDEIYGPGMKAASFGASLLGSLPDPVNLIPFTGGMKAASLGGSALKGMIEGAVGTAVVDALVLPDLISKGEDLGFADALLDIAFGAALGAGLGGIGGYVGKRRREGVERMLREQGEADGSAFARSLSESESGALHAEVKAASLENAVPQSPLLPRNDDADILRASLDPASRRAFIRGMEKALADIHADRPVDVGRLIDGTRTITHVQYQSFIAEIEHSAAFTDVNFGRLRSDLKDSLNAIRTEEGVSLLEGDNLIIPANVVKKLHEKRMLEGHMSADDVGQLLLNVFHRDADIASSTKYPHIQAVVALRKDLSEIGFIGRNDKTGETVIKSVYYEKTPKVHKRLGGDGSRSVKKEALDSGGRGVPHPVDGTEAPPFAASRLSAVQNQEPVRTHITAPNAYVNAAVEAADEFAPAPPLSQETRALADELHMDPNTGLLPEEVKAAELEAAGRVAPEDRDALLAAQEEARRVPEYDDIGQGVIPCILEVNSGK